MRALFAFLSRSLKSPSGMRRRWSLALATLCASTSFAWDSVCTKFPNKALEASVLEQQMGTPCEPSAGPATARERWIGALGEHRKLWEMTRIKAGLPEAVSATRTLTVFTGPGQIDIGGTMVPTLVPVPFASAARVAYRSYSVGEFTHLPDFSWALWDWASGHEVCPLEGSTSLNDCHDFAAHMGPVNSNHFVPQSREYYSHYHSLALARAAECRELGVKLTGSGGRFDDYRKECELEALTLEAVGQHYLQDAWSMGHMWERWGSSSLTEFPGDTIDEKRDRAVLTALVSGFFHGARGVLQALPSWTTFDVNDAMCAPWDGVRFQPVGGDITRGVGDDYLTVLTGDPTYEAQGTMFFQCSVSGLLEVYSAAGEAHGVAMPEGGFVSVDPASDKCFGQRATNQAIALGGAINFKVANAQTSLPIDARFVSMMLPKVARGSGKVAVGPKIRNEFRFELQRAVTVARLRAKDDPHGTSLATGGWGTFMGAKPNGQYSGIASYIDAAWPWDETNDRTQYVRRTFNRAHATEFCASTTVADIDLLRTRAQDMQLSIDDRVAACTACTELAVRHLRIGTGPGSYDDTQKPLCDFLNNNPAHVYHQVSGVTDPLGTATRYCCQ